jgi:hypothetical protein
MTRLVHVWMRTLLLAVFASLPASCSRPSPQANQPAAAASPVSFVNKVWRVASSSSGLETGVLYVFLSDGTLVISSPHGTPSFGKWTQEGDGLTMIEEGLPYKVNVLKLSADEFRIMINNPGNAVEIAFAPAEQLAGPKAPDRGKLEQP